MMLRNIIDDGEDDLIIVVNGRVGFIRRGDGFRALLLWIDPNGNVDIYDEWNLMVNSVAVLGDLACFGSNRMVIRYDVSTGERELYTYKTPEEVEEMIKNV